MAYELQVTSPTHNPPNISRRQTIDMEENFAKAWARLTNPQLPTVKLQKGTDLTFADLHMSLKHTLRIPNNGKTYPLPASLGSFPLFSVT